MNQELSFLTGKCCQHSVLAANCRLQFITACTATSWTFHMWCNLLLIINYWL